MKLDLHFLPFLLRQTSSDRFAVPYQAHPSDPLPHSERSKMTVVKGIPESQQERLKWLVWLGPKCSALRNIAKLSGLRIEN